MSEESQHAPPPSPDGAPLRTIHINTERTWRGGEKQALLLMLGLRERGHSVELICPPDSPVAERSAAEGIAVHPIKMRGEANPVPASRIRKIFLRGEYDVCHMHTSHAHTFGVLARGLRRRPITVVSRRVDFSIYRRAAFGLNWFKYRFGVDRFVAISRAIRDVLVQDGIDSSRISVVHSGVKKPPPPAESPETIRAQLGLPGTARVIGNVAHLASHKGQIHFVSAMANLQREFPDVHAVIVGEGGERASIEARIAELGVGDRVHLVGFKEDVSSYLNFFDFFCMPSVQEGLCTSLLDALQFELPVVASEAGGIPEIIRPGETGLLAQPGDAHDLADKLGELLRAPDQGKSLAVEGQRVANEEFSVEQMVDGNIEVYRATLERKPAR